MPQVAAHLAQHTAAIQEAVREARLPDVVLQPGMAGSGEAASEGASGSYGAAGDSVASSGGMTTAQQAQRMAQVGDWVLKRVSSSSSSSSSLHFQLRPACGLHEYTSQAALEHTQATITHAGYANC
jgi:hypothetical protein